MGRRPFFYKDFAVLLKRKFPGKMLPWVGALFPLPVDP